MLIFVVVGGSVCLFACDLLPFILIFIFETKQQQQKIIPTGIYIIKPTITVYIFCSLSPSFASARKSKRIRLVFFDIGQIKMKLKSDKSMLKRMRKT